MRASRDRGCRSGGDGDESAMSPDRLGTFAPRWLAGAGIIRGDLRGRTWTRSSRTPSPPGAAANAASSSLRPQPQLLGDDRRVGLDVDREALEADDPARARGRRARAPRRAPRRWRSPAPGAARPRARAPGPPRGSGRRSGASAAPRAHGHAAPATAARAARRARRAPSGPARTSQAVRDRAQRRVEVVERRRRHERLGQLGDPPDEVRPAVRVELAEDVVEQEQRRAAVERGQQVELGELEREDRRPLLAARREPGQVAAAELEGEVVAVRADERRAVPDLLLGRLGEAPGQGVARRLAGRAPGRW